MKQPLVALAFALLMVMPAVAAAQSDMRTEQVCESLASLS